MAATMFPHARGFSIHGSQFFSNAHLGDLPESSHSTPNKNATITYENIRLATPAAPTVFTGRDKLVVEAVQELCQHKHAHIAILGAGGMGKTALALHLLKDVAVKKKFGNKIYFVPLQSLKLTVTEGHSPYETLEKHLDLCQDPMLIVLDSFETPWYRASDQDTVLNLIEQIMSHSLVSIVLTMRAADGPGHHKWHRLGGQSGLPSLDLGAARQAFMLISNSQSEDVGKLDWLLNEIDCMPLAILLIAQFKKHLSLDTLIKKWKSQKTKMLKSGVGMSRQTSLSTSIDTSLEILLVSENNECIKILPILSFLPNGVPLWQETLGELVVEADLDVERSVISLCQLALIYEENNGLKMLSPIREDLQCKYPTQTNHLRQIGRYYMRLLDHYSPGKGQDVIEDHSSNITKILGIQLQDFPEHEYLTALYKFAEYTKFSSISVGLIDIALTQRWDDTLEEEIKLRFMKGERLSWIGEYQRAVAEIETIQLRLQNMNIQQTGEWKEKNIAKCVQKLGNMNRMQNKYSEAKLLLTDAQTQFEQIGDQPGAAECLKSLGNICHMQNEYSEAKLLLTDAKTRFEKLGDKIRAAQCLKSLADTCHMRNEYAEAKLLFTDAKTQFERLDDQLGAAQCLRSLGDICRMQNEYLEAKSLLVDAQIQFEKIGSQIGATQCLQSLGDMLKMQSKYSEATLLLTDAKNQFAKIGNQLGVAQCLKSLGNIYLMQNEYLRANLTLTDAKAQFDKMGNQIGVAQCLRSLGDMFRMQSKYKEATSFLSDAKSQFDKIGDQLGAAQCLRILGDIYRNQGRYLEAKSLHTDAKTQFEQIGNPLGAAQCLKSLGNICLMQNEYSEASLILMDAKAQFEKIGNQIGATQCLQSLGDMFGMQSKYSDANLLLTDAKNQFEELGNQLGVAQCLRNLGNICLMQSKYSEARPLLASAQAQFEKAGNQVGAAQCLQSLGKVCYLQNEHSQAKIFLTDAKMQFDKLGDQIGASQCLKTLESLQSHSGPGSKLSRPLHVFGSAGKAIKRLRRLLKPKHNPKTT